MKVLKFYTDEHIDLEIVKQLRKSDIDVRTSQEAGLLGVADDVHLSYATIRDRIVLTCDDDFMRLDSQWIRAGKTHAGIIFIHGHVCNNIGVLVNTILFWQEAIDGGAASVEDDFYGKVIHIT